ncbi:hypothetical protein DID80_02955 [Candidatus Marinamargulisbacteria bacterium SCGC AAA071-K20]|nr:hypothetical protein DID80_02955 [Candidatus Marinamargulisbacteria bacterium SCGC AAA071-K20]
MRNLKLTNGQGTKQIIGKLLILSIIAVRMVFLTTPDFNEFNIVRKSNSAKHKIVKTINN